MAMTKYNAPYRAKTREDGPWVYGYRLSENSIGEFFSDSMDGYVKTVLENNFCQVSPLVLEDENGDPDRIFDGDIIKHKYKNIIFAAKYSFARGEWMLQYKCSDDEKKIGIMIPMREISADCILYEHIGDLWTDLDVLRQPETWCVRFARTEPTDIPYAIALASENQQIRKYVSASSREEAIRHAYKKIQDEEQASPSVVVLSVVQCNPCCAR